MIRNEPSLIVTETSMTETSPQGKTPLSTGAPVCGAVLVLIQFDVCEEIKLDQLREIFGARTVQQPSFKHPTPGYVRYQRPPVVEPIEPLVLESGERLEGQIKYYDYGVLSVVLEFRLPEIGTSWSGWAAVGSGISILRGMPRASSGKSCNGPPRRW